VAGWPRGHASCPSGPGVCAASPRAPVSHHPSALGSGADGQTLPMRPSRALLPAANGRIGTLIAHMRRIRSAPSRRDTSWIGEYLNEKGPWLAPSSSPPVPSGNRSSRRPPWWISLKRYALRTLGGTGALHSTSGHSITSPRPRPRHLARDRRKPKARRSGSCARTWPNAPCRNGICAAWG
jgi:hypothetical protein